jgi:hypothetical protein
MSVADFGSNRGGTGGRIDPGMSGRILTIAMMVE